MPSDSTSIQVPASDREKKVSSIREILECLSVTFGIEHCRFRVYASWRHLVVDKEG
jgi:hypothetical protein